MALDLPPLRLGSSGAEVGNWQAFLIERGYRDGQGEPLRVDEAFGLRTQQASRIWQSGHGLVPDGVIGARSRAVAVPEGFIQFLQARNFTHVPSSRTIDLIIIHDMEYPETPEGAEWCASFFAAPTAPQASAHYSVDSNSIVQSVRDGDVAWHAKGANHNGIGVEHAGYAKQTRAQWLDDYSQRELAISARLVARLCRLYAIPIAYVDAADLRPTSLGARALRGLTGHRDATVAFGIVGGHTDPGPNFPWDVYLQLVRNAGASA